MGNAARIVNGENGRNGTKMKNDHYGKVLELYVLSLLPPHEEWEFAKDFIDTNEYLSDVKKRVSPLPFKLPFLKVLILTDLPRTAERAQRSRRKSKISTPDRPPNPLKTPHINPHPLPLPPILLRRPRIPAFTDLYIPFLH